MKISRLLYFLPGILSLVSCGYDDDRAGRVRTSETAYLYITSQNNGNITRYDINSGELTTYETGSSDAGGIFYEPEEDALTILSGSASRLETFTGINDLNAGSSHDLTSDFSGTADFENPRDLAVNQDIFVVSDNVLVESEEEEVDETDEGGDGNIDEEQTDEETDETDEVEEVEEEEEYIGRFLVYTRTSSGFSLRNTIEVDFEVWGIEFIGNDLYAVVKGTNELARFDDFASQESDIELEPSKTIVIGGMLRGRGLDYDEGNMVLTDAGDDDSDSDGAFNVIPNFDSKFTATSDGNILSLTEQIRISGENTRLGNPVNVVYDAAYNTIFIAENSNGGGRILAFANVLNSFGDISPRINRDFPGASSLYFFTQ